MTDIPGCPVCGAPDDEACTTPAGRPRNDHKRRVAAHIYADHPWPEDDPPKCDRRCDKPKAMHPVSATASAKPWNVRSDPEGR